ncbi:MAG TPA: metallophosphoesterase family protein [Chthoniobacteraceae bacterium]|jgi:putative phosphoesterase|nr:metallophosphoesterase family protein [Chthoniobacteraceae bacterium]
MRIAVLSDTHDRLPAQLLPRLAEAEEIWHLGDVCSPSIIDTLSGLGRPLRIVHGNCDDYPAWPQKLDFELEGFRILLTHIPQRAAPAGVDLFFHGHTHVPRNERLGRTQFYNPGCITRPNRGAPASWAILELTAGEAPRWTLQKV